MGLGSCLPGKKETVGGMIPFRTFGGKGRGDWGGKSDLEGKGAVALSSWFRAESRCTPTPHPRLPGAKGGGAWGR